MSLYFSFFSFLTSRPPDANVFRPNLEETSFYLDGPAKKHLHFTKNSNSSVIFLHEKPCEHFSFFFVILHAILL